MQLQSSTDKSLLCFKEALTFQHIFHPTIKLAATDSTFSA